MNREIKFRLYSNTLKVIYSPETEIVHLWSIKEAPNGKIKVDDGDILMQFTGLKDKGGKGNDVYEGDVFEAIYKDCPDGFEFWNKETTILKIPAVVVYKWSGFYVEMIHPDFKKLVYARLSDFLKNEEKVIIGNVFDNPELIEV